MLRQHIVNFFHFSSYRGRSTARQLFLNSARPEIRQSLSTSATASAMATTDSAPAQPKTPTNLVLHHLNDSRSQRILWLLEELQLPYTITRYQRVAGLAPPELLAVHPLGKSPVITDNGRTIAESGAIVDYIIERYGADRMAVSDYDERLSVNYW